MEDASLRLVSTFRHLGTQATHGARRGPEPLQGRHTCHAQADFESEVPLGQGGGRAGGRWFPVALRRRHVALPRTSTPWRTRGEMVAWTHSFELAGGMLAFGHSRLSGSGQRAEIATCNTAGERCSLFDGALAVRCWLSLERRSCS